MEKTNSTNTTAFALNFAEGDVPEWIQLTPSGPEISGRDGRKWILPNPEQVVSAFRNHGADLPIDIEHATQLKGTKGEAAPAVGWIKDLEVRSGELWAKVDWNEAGNAVIQSKGYRYVSPVFKFERSTGHILKMASAGLTNNPNLELAALNHEAAQTTETKMDTAIIEALGLNSDATAADAVVAIGKLKEARDTALNSAQTPDPDKFVPKADHDLALNRISGFEAKEKADEETAINAALDGAIEAGKIAPASRDYHLAACQEEGGLDRFNSMVEASPVIAGDTKLDGKDPKKGNAALSEIELAACHAMGMTEEDYATAKNEE